MSLIAHYPLNGNLDDIIGNNPAATTVAGVIDANGKIGSCYKNMSSGAIETGIPDMDHSWTVTGWWKNERVDWESGPAFMGTRSGDFGWMLYRNAGDADSYLRWYMHYNNTAGGVTAYHAWPSANSIPLSEWVHFAITRDMSGNSNIYMNGELESSNTTPSDFQSWRLGNTIEIGGGGSDGWASSDISVNDYRIYNHVLSEVEIKEVYKTKLLHYSFNHFAEPTVNVSPESGEKTGANEYLPYTSIYDIFETYGLVQYYVSFEAKAPVAGSVIMYTTDTGARKYTFSNQSFNITTNYKKYTLPIPNLSIYNAGNTVNNLSFYGTYGTGVIPTVKNVQIEVKDHPTPFVDGSRDAVVTDISGFENNAPMHADYSPQWVEDSKLGTGAYNFDLERILGPATGAKDELTLACWVKLDSIRESGFMQGQFYLSCDSTGHLRAYWYGTSVPGYHSSPNILPTGVWTHVAAVWTGAEIILYENAVEVKRVATTTPGNPNTYLAIGTEGNTWPPTSSRVIDGNIDDVRIYATALSATDILELTQTRAKLDNIGNLFVNEVETNGIKSDTKNLVHYEYPVEGAYTVNKIWVSEIPDQYIHITRDVDHTIHIKQAINPIGELDIVQQHFCDVTHFISGTYQGSNFYFNNVVDTGKTYRFSQWLYMHKEPGTSTSQRNYVGITHSAVCNANTTTVNTNPYFTSPDFSNTNYMDKWGLMVYYVYPYGSTGNVTSGTVYQVDGSSVAYGTNYNWATGITSARIRQLHMYQLAENSAGSYVSVYNPRMEIVDGNEPTLESLISCSVHRPLVDEDGNTAHSLKAIGSDGTAKYDNVSEVGVTNGLIGYWKLQEDALDYSGFNRNGTVLGPVKSDGYYFDGVNDTIAFGTGATFFPLKEFTVSIWFNSDGITAGTGDSPGILGFTYGIRMFVNSGGNISVSLSDGAWRTVASSGYNYHDSQLHYITFTCDGLNIYLYVDGVYIGTSIASNWTGTNVWPTNTWNIGQDNNNSNYHFKGRLKNLKLFNRALTSEESLIEYKQGLQETGMQITDNGILYTTNKLNEGL